MKYIILALAFGLTGYLSHNDKVELISQMKDTCHQSYLVINGPLEEACGSLIDRIQQKGDLEVMSDNLGNFWVESRD